MSVKYFLLRTTLFLFTFLTLSTNAQAAGSFFNSTDQYGFLSLQDASKAACAKTLQEYAEPSFTCDGGTIKYVWVAEGSPPGGGWTNYWMRYFWTSGGVTTGPFNYTALGYSLDKPKIKELCPNCHAPAVGNPIYPGTGYKHQNDVDFGQSTSLEFKRFYQSSRYGFNEILGNKWSHSFNKKITTTSFSSTTNGVTTVIRFANIYRENHSGYNYILTNNVWVPDSDITDKLEELKNTSGVRIGWKLSLSNGDVIENYDASGKLITVSNRAGVITQTLSYDTSSRLSSVTDLYGRSLVFAYDASSRVSTVTDPSGGIYTYTYDLNNLISVTYPDAKVRTYHYEVVNYDYVLTGITDENNSRFATFYYNTSGRAISTEHAGAVEKYIATYTTNTEGNILSSAVTDPLGAVKTYTFSKVQGIQKVLSESQQAGSGSAASSSTFTYDANGNMTSKKDFNGYKTTYIYDMTRNLETSRTEGLTSTDAAITGVTRTITTGWHPTWRLPTLVEEYSGAAATGTPVRRTSYTYDTYGNLTQLTESDPTRALNRTTSTTYTYSSTVPGVVLSKVVDGPRTDVNDTTTYTYYAPDATCTASTSISTVTNLGCRGQLLSVTNAIGQTTQYTRYNHHGQVEEMVNPNGLVTTNTYDLRQRLVSRTVGTETTTLQYDGAGQVTLMTMPDSSTLAYTYDAAHRLTKVTDGLGNHVDYTLNNQGNKTAENTYDPSGNLAKTLTRSYDILNRLQSVTGVQE